MSGLHCIDDMRARGWVLVQMAGEVGKEPLAVMRGPRS